MKMNKLFFGLLLQAAFYSGNLYAQTDLRTDAYSIIQCRNGYRMQFIHRCHPERETCDTGIE